MHDQTHVFLHQNLPSFRGSIRWWHPKYPSTLSRSSQSLTPAVKRALTWITTVQITTTTTVTFSLYLLSVASFISPPRSLHFTFTAHFHIAHVTLAGGHDTSSTTTFNTSTTTAAAQIHHTNTPTSSYCLNKHTQTHISPHFYFTSRPHKVRRPHLLCKYSLLFCYTPTHTNTQTHFHVKRCRQHTSTHFETHFETCPLDTEATLHVSEIT